MTEMAKATVNEIAERFRISRNTVYIKIRNGLLVKDDSGLIDIDSAISVFNNVKRIKNKSNVTSNLTSKITATGIEQGLQQQLLLYEAKINELEKQVQSLLQDKHWLQQQCEQQKLIEHKATGNKGLLKRLFG